MIQYPGKRGSSAPVAPAEEHAVGRFLPALCMMALAAALATPALAAAPQSSAASSTHYGWAEVLRVDPVYAPLAARLQQCAPSVPAPGAAAHRGDTRAAAGQDGVVAEGCQPVDRYAPQQHIVGYDVEYRYRGEVYMARMAYDPGERIRVQVTVTPDG